MEQAADEVALEVLDGSFDRTEDRTRELDALAHDSDEVVHRALPLRYLAESRAEVGKDADVARVAGDFVRRRRAWGRRVDIFSTGLRGRFFDDLRLLELARNEGELSDDPLRAGGRSLSGGIDFALQARRALVWAVSEAMPVRTAAEAEEALASFPGGAPSWSDPPVHFERAGFFRISSRAGRSSWRAFPGGGELSSGRRERVQRPRGSVPQHAGAPLAGAGAGAVGERRRRARPTAW
jgi:hypothetical protein